MKQKTMNCSYQTLLSSGNGTTDITENHDDDYLKALDVLQNFHRSCSLSCILEEESVVVDENIVIADDENNTIISNEDYRKDVYQKQSLFHLLVNKQQKRISRSSVSFDCLSDLVKMNNDDDNNDNEMNDDKNSSVGLFNKPHGFWEDNINEKNVNKSDDCNSIVDPFAKNDDASWRFNYLLDDRLTNERQEHVLPANHHHCHYSRPRNNTMQLHHSLDNYDTICIMNSRRFGSSKLIVRKSFIADATRIKKLRRKNKLTNSIITMKAT